MEREINKRIDLAIQATKDVGKLIMDNLGKIKSISDKGDRELVSNVDLEAEERIIGWIKKDFPKDNILCEERIYPHANSDFRWIIDALDGTHNYVHDIEIFGTSIALELCGEVVSGVIYIPAKEELYLAKRGEGAYLNNKRIGVSKRGLKDVTLVYDSRIIWDKELTLSCLRDLVENVFNIRMFGSTARSLTYLAEGKVDVEIEFNDKIWDFAAGLLFVEEAGGMATDFHGRRWNTKTQGFLASNGIVHQDILSVISKYL